MTSLATEIGALLGLGISVADALAVLEKRQQREAEEKRQQREAEAEEKRQKFELERLRLEGKPSPAYRARAVTRAWCP